MLVWIRLAVRKVEPAWLFTTAVDMLRLHPVASCTREGWRGNALRVKRRSTEYNPVKVLYPVAYAPSKSGGFRWKLALNRLRVIAWRAGWLPGWLRPTAPLPTPPDRERLRREARAGCDRRNRRQHSLGRDRPANHDPWPPGLPVR